MSWVLGVVDGNGLAVCKSLFEYVAPILPDMVSLISIYNNYQQITQLVLELFRECSHTMLSDFPMVRIFYIKVNLSDEFPKTIYLHLLCRKTFACSTNHVCGL